MDNYSVAFTLILTNRRVDRRKGTYRKTNFQLRVYNGQEPFLKDPIGVDEQNPELCFNYQLSALQYRNIEIEVQKSEERSIYRIRSL